MTDSASVVEQLRKVGLFRDLGDSQVAKIGEIARIRRFRQGEVVFKEGDPSDRLFLVLQGKVRIGRVIEGIGEEALAILEPGDCFGELSIVDDGPRSADALAHEECALLAINRTELEDVMLMDKGLGYELLWNIARTLAARLRQTNDKITFLSVSAKFG
ncbi:MAG: cyclic nucleotide-binding domain-containing protein [Myxococcota bacterium]|nr:cyclic nucleotide-binding domain-containing protein [Myxococcota bacterium]